LKISLEVAGEAEDATAAPPDPFPLADAELTAADELSELPAECEAAGLASEDLTDHEVEYWAAALAAAASLLIRLRALRSSMILLRCSILLRVTFCSSSGVGGWPKVVGSNPGR
jgi:hypothetical protein